MKESLTSTNFDLYKSIKARPIYSLDGWAGKELCRGNLSRKCGWYNYPYSRPSGTCNTYQAGLNVIPFPDHSTGITEHPLTDQKKRIKGGSFGAVLHEHDFLICAVTWLIFCFTLFFMFGMATATHASPPKNLSDTHWLLLIATAVYG